MEAIGHMLAVLQSQWKSAVPLRRSCQHL